MNIPGSEQIYSYVLDTFRSIYAYHDDLKIIYSDEVVDVDADIIIKKGKLDFFKEGKAIPDDFIWDDWKHQSLPFPFDRNVQYEVLGDDNSKLIIHYDIIAACFYFLSSWQEIYSNKKDDYGRFFYKESFQYYYDLVRVPLVNHYFDILKTAIEQKTEKELKRRLWRDDPFAVFLSHDIDTIHSGFKKDLKNEIKSLNLHKLPSLALRRLLGKDSWNNIEDVVQIEKDLGVRSTFYFLPKKEAENADYTMEEVEPYFSAIEDASSEIGVHGSLGTGFDLTELNNEIRALKRKIYGNRFHYLQYDARDTPPILEATSLEYDSSVGFAEQIGFRNGICFPFREFNFDTGKAYEHLQIPLTIMDTTLMDEELMGKFTHSQTQKQIYDLINEVEKFGGVLTVLWHNTYFTNYKYAGWGDRFIDLVVRLKNKKALFLTGREISDRMKRE